MFDSWLWALLALLLPIYAPAFVHHVRVAPPKRRSALSRQTMELRVDVQLAPREVDDELKLLHARLDGTGLLQHGTEILNIHSPDLTFRHREADGEHYIYVEDTVRGCLAGYTVFNRLIEVNRRLDRFVRAPHSKYASEYQQRGIATAVYAWALDRGFCLISGARQSTGASALWRSLGTRHRLEYIDVRDKHIHFLGAQINQATQDKLQTRMFLLGRGWDVEGWRTAVARGKPPSGSAGFGTA